MKLTSPLDQGMYTLAWIKDFYTQAGVWWGEDPQEPNVHVLRIKTVERLCGDGTKSILELGAGTGASAAALADAGHDVVAVELSPSRAEFARELTETQRAGSLTIVEGDFYTLELQRRFDVICCWETFGLGSDADQRRLLHRMAREWLLPAGCVLMDVYNPARPARDAGTERRLPPLKGVPGSVEMINRCHFDPVHSRWVDEWIPVADPNKALAQAIRCYSPADFLLLLEGTELTLQCMEVHGQVWDITDNRIATSTSLMEDWSYLVQLTNSLL